MSQDAIKLEKRSAMEKAVHHLTVGSDMFHGYDIFNESVRATEDKIFDYREDYSDDDFDLILNDFLNDRLRKYCLETLYLVEGCIASAFEDEMPYWLTHAMHDLVGSLDYETMATKIVEFFSQLSAEDEEKYKGKAA